MKLTAHTTVAELRGMDRIGRAEALEDALPGQLRTLREPVGRLLDIGGRHFVVAGTYCCVGGQYSGDAWEVGTPLDGELHTVSF